MWVSCMSSPVRYNWGVLVWGGGWEHIRAVGYVLYTPTSEPVGTINLVTERTLVVLDSW